MAGTPDGYALAASLTVVAVTQTEREGSIIKKIVDIRAINECNFLPICYFSSGHILSIYTGSFKKTCTKKTDSEVI